jgi:thiamine biosynthesis lipoprotein
MPVTRRSFVAGSAAWTAALGLGFASQAEAATVTFGGHAFASTWRVAGGPTLDERLLRPHIEAIIQRVDERMSPWRRDSAISRFNRNATAAWQQLPSDVCQVVAESLAVAELTSGAFDPTVGPAVARFGFGPIDGGSGSYKAITVQDGAVRKAHHDLTLDLCGIAKGYALDEITNLLRRQGVTSALIELGGEVAAIGNHPTGRAWQVAIEQPGAPQVTAHRIIAPGHLAMASSGHSPNGYHGRVALSHLIDPNDLRPADNGLVAVSVLAPTAMRADALATALTVLGPQRGIQCASDLDLPALFLSRTEAGLTETMTGSFSDHLVA